MKYMLFVLALLVNASGVSYADDIPANSKDVFWYMTHGYTVQSSNAGDKDDTHLILTDDKHHVALCDITEMHVTVGVKMFNTRLAASVRQYCYDLYGKDQEDK